MNGPISRSRFVSFGIAIVLTVVGGYLFLGGCGRDSIQQATSASPASSASSGSGLTVEFAGCDEVRRSGACVFFTRNHNPSRDLTLWTPASEVAASLVPQRGLELQTVRPHAGGQLTTLRVSSTAPAVVMRSPLGTWRLSILWLREPEHDRSFDADSDVQQLARTAHALQGDERARALVFVAKKAARERTPSAAKLRREAAEAAAEAGLSSVAVKQYVALAFYCLFRERELSAAREALRRAKTVANNAESRTIIAYYQGLSHREHGQLGLALNLLRQAERAAERLDLQLDLWLAAQARGAVLAKLGRFKDALAVYSQLETTLAKKEPCHQAAFLTSQSWLGLQQLEVEAREQALSSSQELLLQQTEQRLAAARRIYEQDCTKKDGAMLNLLTNQALAAIFDRDPARAEQRLSAAIPYLRSARLDVSLWRLAAEARVAALQGNYDTALQQYDVMERLARRTLAAAPLWQALVGKARMLTLTSKPQQAISALQHAEHLLDEHLLQVPIGEGRVAFARRSELSARRLVELLVEAERPRDALSAFHRSKRRALSELARLRTIGSLTGSQRRTWEQAVTDYDYLREQLVEAAETEWQLESEALPLHKRRVAQLRRQASDALASAFDELQWLTPAPPAQPPAAGTLRLAYAATDNGWIGFGETSEHLLVEKINMPPHLPAAPDYETLGRRLLEPFAKLIDAASSASVTLPKGQERLDAHRLLWRGQPLLEHLPVSYGLSTRARAPLSNARWLLVADAKGNLPMARQEVAALSRIAAARGLSSTVLVGQKVTRSNLLSNLKTADLFHYAGHGSSAGTDGIDSAIPLAEGGEFTTADILTLSTPPRNVVLTACEAAAVGRNGEIGLARAFVFIGSDVVVGATRKVSDKLAAAFAQGLSRRTELPLPLAARAAQLELRHTDPNQDWAAFRVLTR